MSSKSVLFARVRARVRREIAAAEEAEYEGGEINLVPYLDIITNVVIFLLATISSVVALANLNVAAPRYRDPAAVSAEPPPDGDKPKLNLTVAISKTGFILGGAGGVMKHEDGTLPTIKCSQMLRNGNCSAHLATRISARGESERYWVDHYNYDALRKMIKEIKQEYPAERQAVVNGDRRVPYQVLVRTMDLLRGKSTTDCTGKDGCYFDQVILSAGVR